MKIRPYFYIILFAVLMCQKFQNPFENHLNSDIHILKQGTTFQIESSDTLYIFTSETLLVTATVPEFLDSFSVSVSKNRYFDRAAITYPTAQQYPFIISPYDTGIQSITIQSYKKESSSTSKTILFYAQNPLSQSDLLRQNLNDNITLSTTPVGDQAIYTWILGHQVVRSPFASINVKLSQMDSNEKTGYLYVSDSKYQSPQKEFKFSFYDTVPPSLIYFNTDDFDSASNTITTPDSTFLFRIYIFDGDNQTVNSVSFNTQKADYMQNNIYSKIVNNMVNYTSDNPFPMIVQATDNNAFNNTITDTFYIVFNPNVVITDQTFITLSKSISNPLHTTIKALTISGTVLNTASRVVKLKTSLNGIGILNETYLTGSGEWSSPVTLNTDTSIFTIQAYNNYESLLAQKKITIIYNPDISDNTDPVITSIRVNGSETEASYVNTDSTIISLEAFDYGSGISSVSINGQQQNIQAGQSKWSTAIADLPHTWQAIDIVVTDAKGNKTDSSVSVFFNRLPSPVFERLFPYAIRTDSIYYAEFVTSDPDIGDPLTISLIQHPANMAGFDYNRILTWNASTSDTGKDTLIYQFYDGHQNTVRFKETYIVYNPAISKTIQLSTDQNIPSFLQAEKDTLQFTIKLSDQSGTAPYSYRVQIPTLSTKFETYPSNGLVTWIPEIQDTGSHQMFILVTDGLKHSDTLITPLKIVPPNQDSVKLQLKSTINIDTVIGSIYYINPEPGTVTLVIEILDSDHPLTEDHLVSVTMNGSTTRFHPDSQLFDITYSTTDLIMADTITVTVNDKTSPLTDTLILPLSIYLNSPQLISNLDHWYKAGAFSTSSSGSSTYWKDQTSSWNTLFSPTYKVSTSNKLNTYNTIKLDAWYLVREKGGGGDWISDSFSVYIVAKYDIKSSVHQALISSTYKDKKYVTLGTATDGRVGVFNREESEPTSNVSSSAISTLETKSGTWYVYSFQSKGIKSRTLSIKAGVNFKSDSLWINNVSSSSDIMIGSSAQYYPDTPWTGEFAEIVMFDRYLSSVEHRSIITYLMKKFDIN